MKYLASLLLFLLLLPAPTLSQAVLRGTVTNNRGQPEAAVLVRIESLNVGASTSADGTYQLVIPDAHVQPGQSALVVASRAGLSPVSRTVTLSPGATLTQNFQMSAAVILLNDVVVTGVAGHQRRGGADDSITIASLQGRVAGATIVSPSGQAGAAPSIVLRGPASIDSSRGNEPLYIVDGVILANAPDIAATDIESIEVIKGAAASSLYGARAASGVVHITTGSPRYVIGARGGALRWTPDFPWPPPRWTTRHDLPPSLLEGGTRTLGGVFGTLRDALVRAGYDEWAVYELGRDGFVVVAKREVIDEAGEPIPPRWVADDRLSWSEYFRALFFASPGRYRIIAIVVSPRRFRPGGEAHEDVLTQFVLDGSRMLPSDYASIPLAPGTQYTALIYEFFRRTEDSPTRLVTRSRISSVQHLTHAQLWTRRQLLGGR